MEGVVKMQIPFLAWLLQGIPETIALVTFIMVLSTQEIHWKKILKVALLQAVTAYIVRLLPFTMGVHTIVLVTTMALYLSWLAKIKFPIAATGSAIAIAILIVFEFLFYYTFILAGFGSFSELIYKNVWIRILVTYPQVIALFGLAWFSYHRKYNISKLFSNISKDW